MDAKRSDQPSELGRRQASVRAKLARLTGTNSASQVRRNRAPVRAARTAAGGIDELSELRRRHVLARAELGGVVARARVRRADKAELVRNLQRLADETLREMHRSVRLVREALEICETAANLSATATRRSALGDIPVDPSSRPAGAPRRSDGEDDAGASAPPRDTEDAA